jgi:glycerate kinase
MRILIAPNAFKNSLTAPAVAEAIRQGLLQSSLSCTTQSFPIGDGGDGTASLIIEKLHGITYETEAKDPNGRKIKTSIGMADNGKTAVIEMADISGLKLLGQQKKDPLHASSSGTGELIRFALDKGARKIILCIGGSATVDGGCGILQVLGIRFLDASKNELNGLPLSLLQLDAIDITGIDKRISETEFVILCDVDNLLLGEKGAAAFFGPQKGATRKDVRILEKALSSLRDVSFRQTGKDMSKLRHGGAAGGAAAGLNIFLNAKLVQGAEHFLDIAGFDQALRKADLLITGEGSIDLQTLGGKGPFSVALRAKKNNIPVIGLAGQIPLEINNRLNEYFDVLLSIGHQPESVNEALGHTAMNLYNVSYQIGKLLMMRQVEHQIR